MSRRHTVLRVGRWHAVWSRIHLALVFALVTGTGLGMRELTSSKLGGVFLAMVAVALYLGARWVLAWLWNQRTPSNVEVERDDVRVGDDTAFRCADLRRVVVSPDASVRLWRTGDLLPTEFVAPSLDAARALADAVGHGTRGRAATFRASGPLWNHAGATMLGMVTATLSGFVVGSSVWRQRPVIDLTFTAMMGACFGIITLGLTWGRTLTIGADGYAITWLGTRTFRTPVRNHLHNDSCLPSLLVGPEAPLDFRGWHESFVPFVDVLHIEEFIERRGKGGVAGVRIHKTGGRSDKLVLGTHRADDNVAACALRLRDAISSWTSTERAARTSPKELERDGRPLAEWVTSVRALAERASGFREVTLSKDALWRVVENAAARASTRAAAALALARSLEDEGERARLARVAEASAQPKLRIAIERAMQPRDDDAELLAALEELDELDRSHAR